MVIGKIRQSWLIRDPYIKWVLATTVILLLAVFGIVYFYLDADGKSLIIHFNRGNGIDFSGARNEVYGILFSGLGIILINGFLAVIFYRRVRFLAYLTLFFNLFLTSLLLIAVAVIISVN